MKRLVLWQRPSPGEYADFIYDVLRVLGQVFTNENDKLTIKLLNLEPGLYVNTRTGEVWAGGAVVLEREVVLGHGTGSQPLGWMRYFKAKEVERWYKRSWEKLKKEGKTRFKVEGTKVFVAWEKEEGERCDTESNTSTSLRRLWKKEDSSLSERRQAEGATISTSRRLTDFVSSSSR